MSSARLRLGTRTSPLARWQAEWVARQLTDLGVEVELVPITTQGDVKSGPLGEIGGQGLFTKEIQRALLAGQIDLAVHSCKDLPTEEVPGLTIAAIPPRESTSDVLVSANALTIAELPPAARIGTGSLRRKAQLLAVRGDLVVEDIRGNVETRLEKLERGEYDALVLAEAGLKRLDLEVRFHVIPRDVMLPAVGQGALAVEARADDAATLAAVAPLDHPQAHDAVRAERALLAALRAGCLAPVGACGHAGDGQLTLEAVVLSPDGTQRLFARSIAPQSEAVRLGQQVASTLLTHGAAKLIEAARAGS